MYYTITSIAAMLSIHLTSQVAILQHVDTVWQEIAVLKIRKIVASYDYH